MRMTRRRRDDEAQHVAWNDIRRVGPLLLATLLAVLMISPTFASADSSVGGIAEPCYESDYEYDAAGDCCEPVVFAEGDSCDPPPILEEFDPCSDDIPSTAVVGVLLMDCPEEEVPAPVRVVPDAPPPIRGPIWVGAIQPTTIAPGLTNLAFPPLLDIFIADNTVVVLDGNGAQIYVGPLPEDGNLLVFGDAPMTVVTTLTNRARYTEVIPG